MQQRLSPRIRRAARAAGVTTCGVAIAVSVAAGTGAFAGGAGASSSSAKKAGSKAATVVASTRKAILAESSVRITSKNTSTSTHKLAETAVFDAGRTTSIQRYNTKSDHVEIRLTAKSAWFSGNKAGLSAMFNMPAKVVKKVGSKWVAIPKSAAQYKDFSSAVLTALPNDFLPSASAKSLHLSTRTKAGKQLDVLSWTVKSSGSKGSYHLLVAAKGRKLPIRETEVAGKNRMVSAFSHWNEHLVVRTPRHTIDFSKL